MRPLVLTPLRLLPLAVAPLALACTDPGEPGPPDVTTGTYHDYVQRGWILPHNATEAQQLGFDLDGDGHVEDQAGTVIGALAGLGLEIEQSSADAFTGGDLIALHRLRADDLVADPSVEWTLFEGAPGAAPRFDGSDRLLAVAQTGQLAGMIHDGRAELAWGGATIALPFFPGQDPLRIPLGEARMVIDLDASGCHGRVGGSIAADDITGAVLPTLAAEAIIHMARHPEHRFTEIAHQVFDDNHDAQVTVDEILADPVTRGLFSSDLDTDGDGQRDAVSFGLGFECAPATITATP